MDKIKQVINQALSTVTPRLLFSSLAKLFAFLQGFENSIEDQQNSFNNMYADNADKDYSNKRTKQSI